MKYETIFVPTNKLAANPWNSNRLSSENFEKLKRAISRLGMFKPIVVRENNDKLEILGGEHRWRAALDLGMGAVPIVNLGPITDQRAQEIGLADNSRYGVDDEDALALIMSNLDIDDVLSFIPMNEEEIKSLVNDECDIDADLDDEPPGDTTTLTFGVPTDVANEIEDILFKVAKQNKFDSPNIRVNLGQALTLVVRSY